jgi:hypothetical protein
VLRRLWPNLLPEKRAQIVELARMLSLSPSTRRLLHELADLEAAEGRKGLVRRLRELRASLLADDAGQEEAEPAAGSAATEEVLGLLDQDHGFEDEVRLALAQSRLGPTARRYTLQFVEALAATDLAAASTAGRSAYEQVESEYRRRVRLERERRGDPDTN